MPEAKGKTLSLPHDEFGYFEDVRLTEAAGEEELAGVEVAGPDDRGFVRTGADDSDFCELRCWTVASDSASDLLSALYPYHV